jgi:hypothetical protein
MLKCPRKNKNCNPCLIYKCKSKNFICSGINNKPTKYKKDYVTLCLKGQLSNRIIEMTCEEACFIASAIMSTTGNLAPAIIKDPNV